MIEVQNHCKNSNHTMQSEYELQKAENQQSSKENMTNLTHSLQKQEHREEYTEETVRRTMYMYGSPNKRQNNYTSQEQVVNFSIF